MAISTYAELKTAIEGWTDAGHLSGQVDTFIDLAEARMQRDLRLAFMETSDTLTTTASTATVALPADFLEIRTLEVDGNPPRALEYVRPNEIVYAGRAHTESKPYSYTIIGSNLSLAPVPDAAYTLNITYYAKFTALSDANTTNWLLANAPDAYLYGSLVELAIYDDDRERVATFKGLYDEAIRSLKAQDAKRRWNAAPIRERLSYRVP